MTTRAGVPGAGAGPALWAEGVAAAEEEEEEDAVGRE